MTVVPLLVVTAVGAAVALLTRRVGRASTALGLLGLVVAAIVATGIQAGDAVTVGGIALEGSAYARLFLVLGAVVGLLLVVLAVASGWPGDLPWATLGGLFVAAVVLATREPLPAAVAATTGGLFGVALTLGVPTVRSVVVASLELRALVVAGGLAIGAIAWSSRFPDAAAAGVGIVGLAYLAGVAAIAIRFGAIPFHVWAARVADAAPETALPLVMAWGPAVLAVVGLGWIERSTAIAEFGLGLERAIVVLVAALTVALASIAATIHEDLEHVVGYGTIADAGFVVLALATLDPTVLEPARAYLIVYILAKSAFAGWAAATRQAFGLRRVSELGGWARRSPLLAIALVVILVASVGLPGVAVWELRAAIARTALDGPLAVPFVLAGLAPTIYVGRLLAVGYGRTTATVAAGADPWPRLPDRARPRSVGAAISWAAAAWRENRAPIAAVLVLLLGGLAVTVAAGGLGIREAAIAYGSATTPGP